MKGPHISVGQRPIPDASTVNMKPLVERMRRSLSVKHLVQSEHGLQIAGQTVRARIESDQTTDERMPLLVIDGRDVSWEEFGRMLMTFEGWQFRLEIGDRSDEI
ncbi:MAG: hypothetical protein HYY77_11200 [Betaproteobacteria bacterium]|nr:hypothetical protein [Betaproteobacteria bacterium]